MFSPPSFTSGPYYRDLSTAAPRAQLAEFSPVLHTLVLLHRPDPVAAQVQRTMRANASTIEASTRGDFLAQFQYHHFYGKRTDRATRLFLEYSPARAP